MEEENIHHTQIPHHGVKGLGGPAKGVASETCLWASKDTASVLFLYRPEGQWLPPNPKGNQTESHKLSARINSSLPILTPPLTWANYTPS